MANTAPFNFLLLPPELRAQIFSYLLPFTLPSTPLRPSTVWIRGSITPLLLNQQLHHEAAAQLYGTNTFALRVTYLGTRFLYSWLLPSGLRPSKALPFDFGERYMRYVRHVVVSVEHVDSYKGMIKYNCGGRGLSEGVRRQVESLVELLGQCERLGRVEVRLEGSAVLDAIRKKVVRAKETFEAGGVGQEVLEPFARLKGVAAPRVGGSVDGEFARSLEQIMGRDNSWVGDDKWT
ncbi:hypothetical protein BT63DRAFT_424700 [Microthyrium microscopicum]|uniref:F-box domain-containing protein n=1 Tax=Microthyrium microscopicum TaxID=703497 RepID=A0A6A6UBI3_9PEZI|nr:hypothetical protein BT63DRAFT_424700 [Microthyrium microscopicum]